MITSVILAFAALTLYFGTWNYYSTLEQAENASLMRLSGIANTLSLQIDGDAHERLMRKYTEKDALSWSEQDTDYFQIHTVLRRNWDANMLKTPVYTIVIDSSNHTCVFGVTSANSPYFRHPYHSAPAKLFEKHSTSGSIGRYRDEFGVWLSAFSAVKNSQGKIVAIVQADQRFDQFMNQTKYQALTNAGISLVAVVALLILLLRILQPILRRERYDKENLEVANHEIQNISEQLQASISKITALDNWRKEMIANLSHDLRTPVASIQGYLETALQRFDTVPEQRKYLETALTEARRLSRLIGDLFQLSKLESGRIELSLEPFNIGELAQDILHKYQLPAAEKNLQLLTKIPETLPLVCADIQWIDRVLQNLLDNAVRYAPPGGFVMFTAFESMEKIHFKVCNNGIPIPKDQLSSIFDRFFSAENRNPEGSGLGLAIVKKIIAYHGEAVWAEVNEDITTLRFTLAKHNRPASL